jgi:hypothetical protein
MLGLQRYYTHVVRPYVTWEFMQGRSATRTSSQSTPNQKSSADAAARAQTVESRVCGADSTSFTWARVRFTSRSKVQVALHPHLGISKSGGSSSGVYIMEKGRKFTLCHVLKDSYRPVPTRRIVDLIGALSNGVDGNSSATALSRPMLRLIAWSAARGGAGTS